jgi:heat shock protein HslJ
VENEQPLVKELKMLNKLFSPLIFVLLIVVILLSACVPGQVVPPSLNLDGTMWNLAGFRTGEDLTPPVLKTQITLDFKDGQVSGSAGCNGYGASYTLDGNNISFSTEGFVSTMMFCEPQEIMDQESRFLTWMQNAETVELQGAQLIVHAPEGDLVFDEAQAATLEGTLWQLSGLVEGDAVVSTPLDEKINMKFENGQLTGSGGCNQFFADYTIEGEKLTLGVMGSSKMACGDEIDQREAVFLGALTQAASYRLERATLTLLDANGNALMSFYAGQ